MEFKTDLNERERKRYSEQLRQTAKSINAAADALSREDDQEFLMNFLFFSIAMRGFSELQDVVLSSVKKQTGESKIDSFPDVINP